MKEIPVMYNQHEQELEEKRNMMIIALASLMHEKWREGRLDKETNTYEPRMKNVKDEAWIGMHNGQREVDIANTPFADLPADWQEENYLSAKEAIEKLEDALYIIHDKWLDRNDAYASQEQRQQYSRLTAEEKSKDIAILEEAIDIMKQNL